MKATDLSVGDLGRRFRSPLYRDNNKTSLPIGQRYKRPGRIIVLGEPVIYDWELTELHVYSNGNIKVGNMHLRADTEIERND